ncbi:MAG: CatB-related O-acetyltransferase [Legionellaceae bacterium]|nr:CatB-related O-acetyltransferase [Legionellaceae bacterium]
MINPLNKYPIKQSNGETWPHTLFLKSCIDQPNITVGEYSYYNDFSAELLDVRQKLMPYMHPSAPEKLIIGKFVQIAHGVQIITSSANHPMDGISTYPFSVFGEPWSNAYEPKWPNKGDTHIGDDVWIGHQALIMPAVSIGPGAIIGSGSVVTKDVPPYTLVAGNPAKIIRKRFDETTIETLLEIQWWHWPIETITNNLKHITTSNIEQLKKIAENSDLSRSCSRLTRKDIS